MSSVLAESAIPKPSVSWLSALESGNWSAVDIAVVPILRVACNEPI